VAVDHHLLDLVVGEQLLERPESDRVAQDQVGDLLAPGRRQRRRVLVDERANAGLELDRPLARGGLGAAALDQPQAELAGEGAGVVVGGGDTPLRPPAGPILPA
jgi:hypothetical protein